MNCKNDIGCDERCWKISKFQVFLRQIFIAAEKRLGPVKKNWAKKISGVASGVIKDLTRSPAIYYWLSTIWMKRLRTFFYAYLSTDNVRCESVRCSTVVNLKTFSHQSIARLKFVVECDWNSKISELRNFFVKKPVFFSRKTWFFFKILKGDFFPLIEFGMLQKRFWKQKAGARALLYYTRISNIFSKMASFNWLKLQWKQMFRVYLNCQREFI